MSKYTAPHRAASKRSLSRSTKILSTAAFLLLISLFAVVRPPAQATAANPVYATFQYVDNAISTALSPIQSAIASLQQTQTNQAAQLGSQQTAITNLQSTQATHTLQISDLQTQQTNQAQAITNLQNSTAKSLKVYDANGQELGLLVNNGGNMDSVYSPSLHKFIYVADNEYSLDLNNNSILTSGIGNPISDIHYQSSDCTGTPYASSYSRNANNVMAFTPTEYYTYQPPEPMTTITVNSIREFDINTLQATCMSGPHTAFNSWQLYPVTLPFTTPLALPLQFKYQ